MVQKQSRKQVTWYVEHRESLVYPEVFLTILPITCSEAWVTRLHQDSAAFRNNVIQEEHFILEPALCRNAGYNFGKTNVPTQATFNNTMIFSRCSHLVQGNPPSMSLDHFHWWCHRVYTPPLSCIILYSFVPTATKHHRFRSQRSCAFVCGRLYAWICYEKHSCSSTIPPDFQREHSVYEVSAIQRERERRARETKCFVPGRSQDSVLTASYITVNEHLMNI